MPRSVNHVASRAKRKKILKLTRGYFGARKNVWTVAKNTWEKGLTYAYALQQADGPDSQVWYRDQPQGARRPGYEQSRRFQGYR